MGAGAGFDHRKGKGNGVSGEERGLKKDGGAGL